VRCPSRWCIDIAVALKGERPKRDHAETRGVLEAHPLNGGCGGQGPEAGGIGGQSRVEGQLKSLVGTLPRLPNKRYRGSLSWRVHDGRLHDVRRARVQSILALAEAWLLRSLPCWSCWQVEGMGSGRAACACCAPLGEILQPSNTPSLVPACRGWSLPDWPCWDRHRRRRRAGKRFLRLHRFPCQNCW